MVMETKKPRHVGLAGKINGILALVLGIGLGLLGFLFSLNLYSTRDVLTKANLAAESAIIYTAIENLMLPGEAPIAVHFFEELKEQGGRYRVGLFRRDGIRAFADNTTVARVNGILGKQRFADKKIPGNLVVTKPERPFFDQASGIPPEEVFFDMSEGDRMFFRTYRPLLNLPKCTVCHGADHTIRGVIDVQTDITDTVKIQTLTIAASAIGMPLLILLLAGVIGAFLRRVVVHPVGELGKLCASVSSGDFGVKVERIGNDEIGGLARSFNDMVKGLYERYELTKYVSAGAISALSGDQEPRRVARTLLFTDVRGFTSYTERHDAEGVVHLLNRLLEAQSRIIHETGGDIDKFVGDEVVAVFSGDDSAVRACDAARQIMLAVDTSSEYDGLRLGAGISTGQVIQGKVGSERRADFTVIGNSVNVAARLCSKAKPGQVIVCAKTRENLEGTDFIFAGPYSTALKGKSEAETVYVMDWKRGASHA